MTKSLGNLGPLSATHEQVELRVLDPETIKAQKFSAKEIWYLSINKKMSGPYHANNLKTYLDQVPLPQETLACNVAEKKWAPLYRFPLFSQSAAKLKAESEGPPVIIGNQREELEEGIYAIMDGQMKGPYSGAEIEQLLAKQKLFYTDVLSFDHGETWQKIFTLSRFERKKSSQDLPQSPETAIFQISRQEAISATLNTEKLDQETALAGLVYFGHHNAPPVAPAPTNEVVFSLSENLKEIPWKKVAPFAATFFVVMGLITYWMGRPASIEQEFAKTDSLPVIKDKPKTTSASLITNRGRQPSSTPPKAVPPTIKRHYSPHKPKEEEYHDEPRDEYEYVDRGASSSEEMREELSEAVIEDITEKEQTLQEREDLEGDLTTQEMAPAEENFREISGQINELGLEQANGQVSPQEQILQDSEGQIPEEDY